MTMHEDVVTLYDPKNPKWQGTFRRLWAQFFPGVYVLIAMERC